MSARAAPTCLTCNYALTGVAAPRCPECGHAFNLADPTTFGPRTTVLAHILETLDGLLHSKLLVAVFGAIAACLLLFFSGPSKNIRDDRQFVPLLFVAAWATCTIIALGVRHALQHNWSLKRRSGTRAQYVLAAIGIAYIVAWQTGAVFWLRWYHAKPQFVAALTDHATSAKNVPRWLGTFEINQHSSWQVPANSATTASTTRVHQFRLSSFELYTYPDSAEVVHDPLKISSGQAETDLGDGWTLLWDNN